MLHIEDGITCGLEIETDFICPEVFFKNASRNLQENFAPTHDASVESDVSFASGLYLKNSFNLNSRGIVIGTELVSNIFNSDEETFLKTLIELTEFLENFGEPTTSERSGIHFHISLTNPALKIIKNILILGSHYESLFFRIGGMGYKFRGEKNDSIYCRPITNVGPPCVVTPEGWAQIFNLYELKYAKNSTDFWEKYGDSFNNAGNRYTPARYVWLNILGLFPRTRGGKKTVEFRVFNKTLNPQYIFATFLMSKYLVHYAIATSFSQGVLDLKENSVFTSSQEEYLLWDFIEKTNFPEKWGEILFEILRNSPQVNLPDYYVKSHLYHRNNPEFWLDSRGYQPEIILETIRFPNFTDIHVLRGE